MSGIELFWLPLGAGGHSVRLNGRVYEAVVARLEHRSPRDLYHSALIASTAAGRYVIESAPILDGLGEARGVVGEGPVGCRLAGRLRVFRYEIRCWRDGIIPDVAEAVDSPRVLTLDAAAAERLLKLAPQVPLLVWGRDELGIGDMWNSNSVVSWLLARAGIDADAIAPPSRGRAPGWHAGTVAAKRLVVRTGEARGVLAS